MLPAARGRVQGLLVRRGKGGRRREVGMDEWAWEHLPPWLDLRVELPVGPLFCVINGPTRGRSWSPAAARADLRRTAAEAGVRRRFAPHQLRHAHAVEMAHEGVPLIVIQRQLATATSASPRSTSKASTTPRSSKPSMPVARRWFRSAPHFGSDGPARAPLVAHSSSAGGRVSSPLSSVAEHPVRADARAYG